MSSAQSPVGVEVEAKEEEGKEEKEEEHADVGALNISLYTLI